MRCGLAGISSTIGMAAGTGELAGAGKVTPSGGARTAVEGAEEANIGASIRAVNGGLGGKGESKVVGGDDNGDSGVS